MELPRYGTFTIKIFAKFFSNLHCLTRTIIRAALSYINECTIIHTTSPRTRNKTIIIFDQLMLEKHIHFLQYPSDESNYEGIRWL